MEKICTRCHASKPLEEYRWQNKAKGTRAPWCKPCYNAYERAVHAGSPQKRAKSIQQSKDRLNRNREYIWQYLLSHPCITCGEGDPIVLEFDHRDGVIKTETVGNLMIRGNSIALIEAEIAKCDVLCANCHRRRTAKQFNWYRDIDTGKE
jgi:hypothetical protein